MDEPSPSRWNHLPAIWFAVGLAVVAALAPAPALIPGLSFGTALGYALYVAVILSAGAAAVYFTLREDQRRIKDQLARDVANRAEHRAESDRIIREPTPFMQRVRQHPPTTPEAVQETVIQLQGIIRGVFPRAFAQITLTDDDGNAIHPRSGA